MDPQLDPGREHDAEFEQHVEGGRYRNADPQAAPRRRAQWEAAVVETSLPAVELAIPPGLGDELNPTGVSYIHNS